MTFFPSPQTRRQVSALDVYNTYGRARHGITIHSRSIVLLCFAGSIVATGYNDIDESIYNAHYRKMSVTPLHRKTTGLPEPSFALHH